MPKVKQKTRHVDEPKPKFVWESSKEESLWEIVEHGENGRLKKKIVNRDSNIKLKLEVQCAPNYCNKYEICVQCFPKKLPFRQ